MRGGGCVENEWLRLLREPFKDLLDRWTIFPDREIEGFGTVELVNIKERRKKVADSSDAW